MLTTTSARWVHRRRDAGLVCATVAAVGLLLSGCGTDDSGAGVSSSSSSSSTSVPSSSAPSSASTTSASSDGRGNGPVQGDDAPAVDTTPRVTTRPPAAAQPTPDSRCTNQTNYAGDPRSNAEINSIGEKDGKCPAPIVTKPSS